MIDDDEASGPAAVPTGVQPDERADDGVALAGSLTEMYSPVSPSSSSLSSSSSSNAPMGRPRREACGMGDGGWSGERDSNMRVFANDEWLKS